MATIEEVKKHAENGRLEDWIDAFLRAEGNNIPLADGLKKQKRYWIGPLQFRLKRLVRCCGPEEELEYRVSLEDWNTKVDSLIKYIQSGGELPPSSCSTARAFSRFETAAIVTGPMRNFTWKHTGR